MKYISLFITVLLQITLLYFFTLLDHISFIMGIYVGCIVMGIVIKLISNKENKVLNAISFGLIYGSIITLAGILIYIKWFSGNLSA